MRFGKILSVFIFFTVITILVFAPNTALSQTTGPSISISPDNGSPGSTVSISGNGFSPFEPVTILEGTTSLDTVTTDSLGTFSNEQVTIPSSAPSGPITIQTQSQESVASATFTVTGGSSQTNTQTSSQTTPQSNTETTNSTNSQTTETTPTPAPSTSSFPSWVKNDAKYWSQGQISDQEYASSIGWMVSNGVINLQSSGSQGAQVIVPANISIPTWIKNSAGFWSTGTIDDSTYASSLQYLLNNNIITFGASSSSPAPMTQETSTSSAALTGTSTNATTGGTLPSDTTIGDGSSSGSSEKPSFTLIPEAGPAGTVVDVLAYGFPSDWEITLPPGATSDSTTTGLGSFEFKVTIPANAQDGPYIIPVKVGDVNLKAVFTVRHAWHGLLSSSPPSTSSTNSTSSAALTDASTSVTTGGETSGGTTNGGTSGASITLLPNNGPAGSSALLSGSGFSPSDTVYVTPGNTPQLHTDSSGSFSVQEEISSDLQPGDRVEFWVNDLYGSHTEATFTVTGKTSTSMSGGSTSTTSTTSSTSSAALTDTSSATTGGTIPGGTTTGGGSSGGNSGNGPTTPPNSTPSSTPSSDTTSLPPPVIAPKVSNAFDANDKIIRSGAYFAVKKYVYGGDATPDQFVFSLTLSGPSGTAQYSLGPTLGQGTPGETNPFPLNLPQGNTLSEGTFQITETNPGEYTPSYSQGCSGSYDMEGYFYTCTIINTLKVTAVSVTSSSSSSTSSSTSTTPVVRNSEFKGAQVQQTSQNNSPAVTLPSPAKYSPPTLPSPAKYSPPTLPSPAKYSPPTLPSTVKYTAPKLPSTSKYTVPKLPGLK